MTEATPMHPEAKRPGLFRRLWRFIKITFVVLVVIIALSYLPASLLGEPESRLRQAHEITLDIRTLTSALIYDASSALYASARDLYRDYDEQLPPVVTDWLDPWLADEAPMPEPAPAPEADGTPDALTPPSTMPETDAEPPAGSESSTNQ